MRDVGIEEASIVSILNVDRRITISYPLRCRDVAGAAYRIILGGIEAERE